VGDLLRTFHAIRGLPGWAVKRGHGSFVTFEFGSPRVVINDVRELPAHVGGEKILVPQRGAGVRGEWHLWIYCCNWSLSWRKRSLAHSESSDLDIDRALTVLNGQSVSSVTTTSDGSSRFAFDLDYELATSPYDDARSDDEQWMFYQPSGRVLGFRANGQLHIEMSDS
jgi:hypothetical protein